MTAESDGTSRPRRATVGAAGGRAAEPERLMLHMPVDVRSLSLVVLAVLASVFALQWAKAVVVPILLGVMFSYALTPAVDRLQRWRIPRAAGAGVVLSAIVAADQLGRLGLVRRRLVAHRDLAAGRAESAPRPRRRAPQALRLDHRQDAAGRQRDRARRRRSRPRRRRRRRRASGQRRSPHGRRPQPPADDDDRHDGRAGRRRRTAPGDPRRRRAAADQRPRLSLDRNARPVRVPRPAARSSSS